jgi:hypothetical protein
MAVGGILMNYVLSLTLQKIAENKQNGSLGGAALVGGLGTAGATGLGYLGGDTLVRAKKLDAEQWKLAQQKADNKITEAELDRKAEEAFNRIKNAKLNPEEVKAMRSSAMKHFGIGGAAGAAAGVGLGRLFGSKHDTRNAAIGGALGTATGGGRLFYKLGKEALKSVK